MTGARDHRLPSPSGIVVCFRVITLGAATTYLLKTEYTIDSVILVTVIVLASGANGRL